MNIHSDPPEAQFHVVDTGSKILSHGTPVASHLKRNLKLKNYLQEMETYHTKQ